MSVPQRKIFGIGLSKTGTKSLSKALEVLGYQTKHFPLIRENVEQGDYDLKLLEQYDALTDAPIAALFPHLDTRHPGSRFILTVRNREDWLRSCERYFTLRDSVRRQQGVIDRTHFWRLLIFGCYEFHSERFTYVYERHIREVSWYFSQRPDDLLIIDICGGQGWEYLCPFLAMPIPTQPFPHENKTNDYVAGIPMTT
ncbi:MAG: hypothetical protein GFH27_549291n46 [Chloroflexi bacterium AL-W]|nr:hypothetical protein [Chloroflexi bacterium AL-N1]NOK67487.1 hypothetical protein [Chloroflexi bacterium AL-N10]NOK75021.1 hypothetical protein [Chloroflexi bacterium AL-N5]NOK81808.1 hypothetical protein [Chloroflexi bacterium AL-W]NOK89654.1 hypothetical protein [Chloroflexi bacterium AL-N15]